MEAFGSPHPVISDSSASFVHHIVVYMCTNLSHSHVGTIVKDVVEQKSVSTYVAPQEFLLQLGKLEGL